MEAASQSPPPLMGGGREGGGATDSVPAGLPRSSPKPDTRALDARVHGKSETRTSMDCRIKSGNDGMGKRRMLTL